MIKLIVSDLDGTLLQNGSQQLTPRAVPIILKLLAKGVRFVAASGRQYPNLCRLFGEASNDMAFICENGAYVTAHGKVIQKTCMDQKKAWELALDILRLPGCELLLSGARTSYLIPKTDSFVDRMQNIVKNDIRVISSLEEMPEEIIKISAYEEAGIAAHSGSYLLNRWQDTFHSTISDFLWMDFVDKSVNKGAALAALLAYWDIQAEEAAAFGDNYNDLEMLSLVKYGYVMEYAAPDIRCRYSLSTSCVEDTLEAMLAGF